MSNAAPESVSIIGGSSYGRRKQALRELALRDTESSLVVDPVESPDWFTASRGSTSLLEAPAGVPQEDHVERLLKLADNVLQASNQ